ncbi:MAG TPA: glutamate--tRNA ligase [Tepidisphaeraceae bacterium]|jgi:glutamyl-tRNA synthetase|nr:glutamate--tRNA ligase [Tepidisphaeraceae bacterium]
MSTSTPIVTRFAPSPTGYLHVGGARTALFNWLLARRLGGTYLLRIEDTDLARSTEEAVNQLVEDLRWLGLHWDNSELVYQSKRLPIYNAIIDQLIAQGRAYKAYESKEELDAEWERAQKAKRQYRYVRKPLTDVQIRNYDAESRPHVVRFAMEAKDYRFNDAVLGPDQGVTANEVQDFIIRKSDGMPTYHFAVVVDDQEMGVSHVLRGQEHLLNTVNHIALQEALGYRRPVYAHLPIIMNMEGEKLGKRDRDKKIRQRAHEWLKNSKTDADGLAAASGLLQQQLAEWLKKPTMQLSPTDQEKVMHVIGLSEADLPEILVHDFRKKGYLPEALLNFLALLGWSPGGDRERMTMDEMVSLFSLDGIGRSNAKFDRAKLLAFNTEAAAGAAPARLIEAFKQYLESNPDSPLNEKDDATLERILTMKKGFRTFREVDEASRFLFLPDEQIALDPQAVEKVLRKSGGQGLASLHDIRAILQSVEPWQAHHIEEAVKQYCERKELGLGNVAQPIRVAISGATISPPIFQSLEFLGKDRTIRRIDRCLELNKG